jgi:hypothetical protein
LKSDEHLTENPLRYYVLDKVKGKGAQGAHNVGGEHLVKAIV